MKWHKNIGAKLTIVTMSVLSVLVGWAFVHNSAPATGASTSATNSTFELPDTSPRTLSPQAAPVPQTRPNTRTRVS